MEVCALRKATLEKLYCAPPLTGGSPGPASVTINGDITEDFVVFFFFYLGYFLGASFKHESLTLKLKQNAIKILILN